MCVKFDGDSNVATMFLYLPSPVRTELQTEKKNFLASYGAIEVPNPLDPINTVSSPKLN